MSLIRLVMRSFQMNKNRSIQVARSKKTEER
jgi:hypothetical protein